MADPIKYVQLDCHLDEKFEYIEAEFGLEGFAIIVKLFQRIYGGQGYYCEWSDRVALLFARKIGVGVNVVREVVSSALKEHVFDEEMEDGGYSQARNRESRVMYNDGNSYAQRGEHYVRGHYSRDDGKEHMIDELHELMEDAQSEHQRSAIRRCIEQLKNG